MELFKQFLQKKIVQKNRNELNNGSILSANERENNNEILLEYVSKWN